MKFNKQAHIKEHTEIRKPDMKSKSKWYVRYWKRLYMGMKVDGATNFPIILRIYIYIYIYIYIHTCIRICIYIQTGHTF